MIFLKVSEFSEKTKDFGISEKVIFFKNVQSFGVSKKAKRGDRQEVESGNLFYFNFVCFRVLQNSETELYREEMYISAEMENLFRVSE